MKITRIETLESATHTNLLWVQVHTDEGLVGLGETFFNPAPVAAYIHQAAAPYLLGQDPTAVERHHSVLDRGMAYRAIGAEARGLSAIDIALWDLFGQSAGLPIYRLLGGPVRDRIRIYNTCAGNGYNERSAKPGTGFADAWGLGDYQGQYEDLVAWLRDDRAADVARSLLEMGITAMKIWPFDQFADETGGLHIRPDQIEKGMRPFRQIRDAVGNHLCMALPNAMIQEGVRAYYYGWYKDVLTELPSVERGFVAAPSGPGLGVRLRPDFVSRPDIARRVSDL